MKLFQSIFLSMAFFASMNSVCHGADYPAAAGRHGEEAWRQDWVRAGGDCGPQLCALDTSIFSLYGSYGPEGGPTYWGSYTRAGWGGRY